MPFNELFGGQVLLPADLTYLALTISADIDLVWPLEQQVGGVNVVADIIDLTASAPGLNVDMPDARLVSPGTSVLFNNVGGQIATIRDQTGATILSIAPGTTWMIYLRDNTTAAGLWRTFQFGASVSVANAAALAGAGLKAIGATLNTRIPVSTKNTTPYNVLDADRAVALVWISGVGTFNLPAAGTVGADWYCIIRNSGSGNLTVTPPSGTIDGAASKTFAAGASSFVVCDGANYFTVGFGISGGVGSGFDFLVINVAGSGDYTLAGAELNRVGYRFIGALTGTRNIVVPGTTEEYWVDNQTTGAFSLFVKTVAQVPGIEVLQTNRKILYCDGTNVVAAESSTISFPIPVNQGGTGAVNAAAARTNLGAAGISDANVFTNTPQTVSNAAPAWEISETGAPADNRLWSYRATGQQMLFSAWNDARAVVTNIMAVDRTGTVIDSVTWPNGKHIFQAELSGSGSGSATVNLESNQPALQWFENGVSANNQRWLMKAENEQFVFQLGEGSSQSIMTVDRTAGVVDRVGFPNGTVRIGDQVEGMSGSLLEIATDGNAFAIRSPTDNIEAIIRVINSQIQFGTITGHDVGIQTGNTLKFSFRNANATTGTATPTLSANKPGANAGVITWIAITTVGGIAGWIPVFGN